MSTFVHPLALCESDQIGPGTRVWAFAHVMQGARVGRDCNIGEAAFVETGSQLGDRVTLKNHALVWEGVTIEDDAFIGPAVVFTNDAHPRSPRMAAARERYCDRQNWLLPTRVGRGAYLGAGAIILPGVTIGAYALVAAGAVVTRDVAPHRLVVGSPARPVGWVCACGRRLADEMLCGACHTAYRLVDETLQRRE